MGFRRVLFRAVVLRDEIEPKVALRRVPEIDDALGVGVLCREADQARAVLGEDLALFLGPAVKTKAWHGVSRGADEPADPWPSGSTGQEIGRASGRERVCKYVEI